ncbi:conserved protein of unknown function [Candidatus Methylacidiphilum fumarolicum]|uniref:Uncharacterized protein n=1 Tax=Candidatus Methylacidiphilum fumarolicum TaxID=591154 RepID=A0ABN8XF82_9BACT|nr:conserved protein of unknown function [Candidatus Methylacidiphilum fumarolicum]
MWIYPSKAPNWDKFVCRYGRYVSYADRIGTYKLKKRNGDPEISLWTLQNRLHAILPVMFTQRHGLPLGWN